MINVIHIYQLIIIIIIIKYIKKLSSINNNHIYNTCDQLKVILNTFHNVTRKVIISLVKLQSFASP